MQFAFFPSRTMSLYMARMFLVRIFAVLTVLVLVLQTLDLLGQSGDILAYPGNGEAQLWTYVSLRVPQLIDSFLPYAVLLATIITLATLNQNSEVIAMKAAGLSAHQVLAPLLIAGLGIALVAFAFNDRVVTHANATLALWEDAQYGPIPKDTRVKTNVWVRDGNDIIQAGSVSGYGPATELGKVAIYRRDAIGGLKEIIRSDIAGYNGAGWRLADAQAFDVLTGKVRDLGTVDVASGVNPDQFTLSKVNADGLSFVELRQAIADLRSASRPTGSLEATFWHKFSGPLSDVLMPLLGAVAAFGLARSGQLFLRAVIGMALGFTYFVADNFALAIGDLGAYPPLLAAWAPFLLFLMVGELVLIRTEE